MMSDLYDDNGGLGDLGILRYFWEERGDIERYTDYENVIKNRPELKKLWTDYKQAEANLSNYFKMERED